MLLWCGVAWFVVGGGGGGGGGVVVDGREKLIGLCCGGHFAFGGLR
jgi:hypothetical protein